MVRIAAGEKRCPSSRRRFQTHWLRICQNSCRKAGMRTPAIGILLDVFISQNRFARTRDADTNPAHLWRKKQEWQVW